MTEHEQRPELKVWELATIWLAYVICATASVGSFRNDDDVWGLAFALLAVFFGVVLAAGHAQRRWNRHGEPDWRARQRRR